MQAGRMDTRKPRNAWLVGSSKTNTMISVKEKTRGWGRSEGNNENTSQHNHCSTCVHFNWKDTWYTRNLTNGTCHRASFNICVLAHGHWDWNESNEYCDAAKNNKIPCKYIAIRKMYKRQLRRALTGVNIPFDTIKLLKYKLLSS